MTARCLSAMTAAARSGPGPIKGREASSARERLFYAQPDREQSIVIPTGGKKLDACRQARGVPSRRQRKAAHPQQIAEKRVVDGAQVGDAKVLVIAFERTDSRGGHRGR